MSREGEAPPLCVDCRHHEIIETRVGGFLRGRTKVEHVCWFHGREPHRSTDPVTGAETLTPRAPWDCRSQRSRFDPGGAGDHYCTPDGIHFEPKEDATMSAEPRLEGWEYAEQCQIFSEARFRLMDGAGRVPTLKTVGDVAGALGLNEAINLTTNMWFWREAFGPDVAESLARAIGRCFDEPKDKDDE